MYKKRRIVNSFIFNYHFFQKKENIFSAFSLILMLSLPLC
jgi:hypothetical protein